MMIVMTVRAICHQKFRFGVLQTYREETEQLFKLIKLKEDSKLLLTSMDLGNVRNVIQLSDQDLHDIITLFSRQDLRDPNF
jgi:hypothetical protein